jgi:hypothetical protein
MPENTETPASFVPQSRWLKSKLLSVYHNFDQRAYEWMKLFCKNFPPSPSIPLGVESAARFHTGRPVQDSSLLNRFVASLEGQ